MPIIHTDTSGKKTMYRYVLYHPIYAGGRRIGRVFANGDLAYPDEYAYKYWTKIRGTVNESWMVPNNCPLMLDSMEANMVGEFTLEVASFFPLVFEDVTSSYLDMLPRIDSRHVVSRTAVNDCTNVVSRLVFAGAPSVTHKRVVQPRDNGGTLYGRITLWSPNVVSQFGTVKRVLGYSGDYGVYMMDNHEYALLQYDGSTLAYPVSETIYQGRMIRDGEDYAGNPQRYAQAVCADGLRCVGLSDPWRDTYTLMELDYISQMESASLLATPWRRYVENGHVYNAHSGFDSATGGNPVTHNLNTKCIGSDDAEGTVTFDACLVNVNYLAKIDPDPDHLHNTMFFNTHLAIPVTEVVDSNYDVNDVSAIWDGCGRQMSRLAQSRLASVYYDNIPDWGRDVIQESRLTYPNDVIVAL